MRNIGWQGLVFYLVLLALLSIPFVVPVHATPDRLPVPSDILPLPEAEHEEPQPAADTPTAPAADGVVYQQQWVTEYVRSCNGRSCQLVPRQVLRRVAVAAASPVRTARVIYQGGVERTLNLLRPVGAAMSCTRTTAEAQTGEQWMGTDEQIYVKQADGTWKPKRDDAKIPEESAPLREPAVSYSIPVRQVSYYPVTMTTYRARTPVFTRRCGPVRRLLGWCR